VSFLYNFYLYFFIYQVILRSQFKSIDGAIKEHIMKPISKKFTTYIVVGLVNLCCTSAYAIQQQDPSFTHEENEAFNMSLFSAQASDKQIFINSQAKSQEVPCGSGTEIVTFNDQTTFSQVASYLEKHEQDLILSIEGGANKVTLKNFFTESNTVTAVDFVTGGRLTTSQIQYYFSKK
jgi:hypothetical protein